MNAEQIGAWLVAAVLTFWAVGAHNRLVALRNALVRAFVPVEQQFRRRHERLLALAELLIERQGDDAAAAVQLRAACAQAESACAVARQRPGSSNAISSLRLAEDILGEARARLGDRRGAEAAVAALLAELGEIDAAFGFARRQFNEAVQAYNDAVQQFPTWIIAGLFRFRGAGTL